ncbi:hypothetical protein A3Q56_02415 [Intoshia linei]|uniref:Uncharacterized protein n=1 Tax=Intoshia linei TaxID=1819745 RepID=A0A177B671_9BILA|nr:hypothetical protein A3Q56_02415 [Intoshia linei]
MSQFGSNKQDGKPFFNFSVTKNEGNANVFGSTTTQVTPLSLTKKDNPITTSTVENVTTKSLFSFPVSTSVATLKPTSLFSTTTTSTVIPTTALTSASNAPIKPTTSSTALFSFNSQPKPEVVASLKTVKKGETEIEGNKLSNEIITDLKKFGQHMTELNEKTTKIFMTIYNDSTGLMIKNNPNTLKLIQNDLTSLDQNLDYYDNEIKRTASIIQKECENVEIIYKCLVNSDSKSDKYILMYLTESANKFESQIVTINNQLVDLDIYLNTISSYQDKSQVDNILNLIDAQTHLCLTIADCLQKVESKIECSVFGVVAVLLSKLYPKVY